MENETIIKKLDEKGIKATCVRILVYKCIESSIYPVSLTEIEKRLETVDKSSISRSLNIFREKGIVHFFDDGTGSVKYEICHSDHEGNLHDDSHLHFHCNLCGETICLQNIKVPEVKLPANYIIKSSNYVISGICPDCYSKELKS